MKTAKMWAWLTRMSVIALLAAVLVSTMSLVAAPVTPVAADSCWGTYQGSGSCKERCDHDGLCQAPDYIRWDCDGRNYNHYKWLYHNDYEKYGGLWDAGKYCAYSNPENCPGWCN